MRVNVKEFLAEAGVTEDFYPGKRFVKSCRQEGQFKSHCVVFDWRNPEKIRIEVKPGLSGKTLAVEQLKEYPISFQSPTYVDIDVINDNAASAKDDDSEDETEGSKGKSGGGSKGQKNKTSLDNVRSMMNAFGDALAGKVPELGEVVEMVVMGTKLAKESFGNALTTLSKQIANAKVCGTELLARAGDFVTKYTPPSFLQPKGDEQASYKYDRNKNADIGMKMPSVS